MKMEVEALKARADRAWGMTYLWYGLLMECFDFVLPNRNALWDQARMSGAPSHSQGTDKATRMFEGTGARGVVKLANRIHTEAFPIGVDWCDLRPALEPGMGKIPKQVEQRMQRDTRTCFDLLEDSNFALNVNEALLECVAGGTGLLKVGTSSEPGVLFDFEAAPQVEVAVDAGARGEIKGFFRKWWITREEAREMWPQAASQIPREPQRELAEPQRDSYLEAIYYEPAAWAWHHDVLVTEGLDGGGTRRIVEEVTDYCPWVYMRWSKAAGEARGRSPVMLALGDIRTLNKLIEIHLKNANLRMAGVFSVVNGGVTNPATTIIRPGAKIVVQSNATANPSIRPLDVGGDPVLAHQLVEYFSMGVKEALLDMGLPPDSAGVRSATEIIERIKQLYQDIGAPIARIQHECGKGVMRAVVSMASKAGFIEPLTAPETGQPQAMRIGGQGVRLRFSTELSKTQELEELSRLTQFGEIGRFLAGEDTYQLKVKGEEVLVKVQELLNVDSTMLRTEEESEEQLMQMRSAIAAGAGEGQRRLQAGPPQTGIV